MIKQKNFLYNSLSIYTNNEIFLSKSRKNLRGKNLVNLVIKNEKFDNCITNSKFAEIHTVLQ